jgi:hypothetical protein
MTMSLLFEPGRLNLTLDDVRAAVETNVRQLAADDADEQRLLKAKRRNHLRLIRGGRESPRAALNH